MIALGALLAIREAGLRCPEDVSLMGFDDLDLAETTNPSLSSVSQSGYQLGTTAARILLDRLEGDQGPAKHVVLETSLKLRHSIAAPTEASRRSLSSNGRRGKRTSLAQ
jgi:LacI family transcriptional regulator